MEEYTFDTIDRGRQKRVITNDVSLTVDESCPPEVVEALKSLCESVAKGDRYDSLTTDRNDPPVRD